MTSGATRSALNKRASGTSHVDGFALATVLGDFEENFFVFRQTTEALAVKSTTGMFTSSQAMFAVKIEKQHFHPQSFDTL
jgi:hypothetical protein